MPNPSLLIVPARFKTGRLYSQIPSNTDNRGDFNVTRATVATRVNASGLIESVASGIPRLDYFASGGVVGCPALLVEPAATNFVPSGTTFSANASLSITATSTSPAVDISGTIITKIVTGTTNIFASQTCLTSLPSGSTTYTISRFFKYNGTDLTTSLELNSSPQWGGTAWKQNVTISAASGVTLGTSTACTGSVDNFGNGWYRVSARFTTGATPSGSATVNYLMLVSGSVASGSSFLTALPQLETGSVATSYIPTTTAAVTRNADVISVTGAVSGSIGQTEGTIYAEFINTFSSSYNDGILIRVFADGNNEVFGRKEAASNRYTFRWRANSQNTTFTNVNVPDGVNKIALAYKSGDTALFLNGAQVGSTSTDVRAFSVNPTTVALGSNGGAGQFFNDRIRAAALYTTRLTNEQLKALTT